MIAVTQINIYPVKSLKGISLQRSQLTVRGLEFDRYWMVVDSSHQFVTQRQLPAMATIGVSLTDERLQLTHPSVAPLEIEIKERPIKEVEVSVWGDRCLVFEEREEASQWLTGVLGCWKGEPLKLCRFRDATIRQVDQNYLKGELSHTAFADGFPFLVTAEESLNLLNQRLQDRGFPPIGMERFRPNIVIKGVEPFAEDQFSSLTADDGRYSIGIRKPCKRCAITTINQFLGEKDSTGEPLKTLLEMNTQPTLRGAHFGQNGTLLKGEGGRLAVGDQLLADS